jgi:hypothetical protein
MEWIQENWEVLVPALLVFLRVVFSLMPTEHPAQSVFGLIDTAITAVVGDRRKKNKLPEDFDLK